MLSNIFLHYVLYEWMEQVVKPRLRGKAFLIRYADDFVMRFTHEQDAQRVLSVLPQRLCKYGLAIHPDKTRLIAFQEPAKAAYKKDISKRIPVEAKSEHCSYTGTPVFAVLLLQSGHLFDQQAHSKTAVQINDHRDREHPL